MSKTIKIYLHLTYYLMDFFNFMQNKIKNDEEVIKIKRKYQIKTKKKGGYDILDENIS